MLNQRGFSPLVILILVVLGVFIFWELNLTLENLNHPAANIPAASPAFSGCKIDVAGDCYDLDSGFGFANSGL